VNESTDEAVVADCYSAGERQAMLATQQWRGWALRPLLRFLTQIGVTADHITALSLLFGLLYCPLQLHAAGERGVYQAAALAMLLLHAFLDGLDGPLARYAKTASRRGSFTDTCADQVVVAAATATLMATKTLSISAGATYLFVYTMVVVFAMVRNSMRAPYSWLVRPRFFVYGWLAVEFYLWPGGYLTSCWRLSFSADFPPSGRGFLKKRRSVDNC